MVPNHVTTATATDGSVVAVRGLPEAVSRLFRGSLEFGSVPGDPLYYPVGAVVVLVGLYGLYRLARRLRRSKGERFRSLLKRYDEVTVLMHPNPDPDAMASAMAVEAIGDRVNTETTVQYPGEIRRPENRAFRTVLGFDCERIEAVSDIDRPDRVVLVDHNTPRGFIGSEGVEPVAVVDHHPGNGAGDEFTDTRVDYGATASILTEYLIGLDAVFDPNGRESDGEFVVDSELATGLTYGVQSDTKNLTHGCTNTDFTMCATLFPAIDGDLLRRIATPGVSHDVLRVKANAINSVRVDGSFGICNVGEVRDVDALSQAVEELIRLEGTTAVVLYGLADGVVHVSARSNDDRVHMGECLQHAVKGIETASAGGHARMAGGQVPLSGMPTDGDGNPDFEAFEDRLVRAMNGEI